MSDHPYMKLYWTDLIGDTQHLSPEEFGCYMLLLGASWTRGGPLPDDDAILARIARVGARKWKKLRPIILDLMEVGGGVICSKRLEKEREKVRHVSTVRSEARKGKKRRKSNENADSATSIDVQLNINCDNKRHNKTPHIPEAIGQTSSLRSEDAGSLRSPAAHASDLFGKETGGEPPPDDVDARAAKVAKAGAAAKGRRKPETACPWIGEGSEPDVRSMIGNVGILRPAHAAGMEAATLNAEATRFINHAIQSDRRCRDWFAAWRNWISKWDGKQANGHRFDVPANGAGPRLGSGGAGEAHARRNPPASGLLGAALRAEARRRSGV